MPVLAMRPVGSDISSSAVEYEARWLVETLNGIDGRVREAGLAAALVLMLDRRLKLRLLDDNDGGRESRRLCRRRRREEHEGGETE